MIPKVSEYPTFSVSFFSLLQKKRFSQRQQEQRGPPVLKVMKLSLSLEDMACTVYSCSGTNPIFKKDTFKS